MLVAADTPHLIVLNYFRYFNRTVDESGVRIFMERLRRFLKEEEGKAQSTQNYYTRWCRRFMIHLVASNGNDATYPIKILKFEIMLPGANTFYAKIPTADEKSHFSSSYLMVCYCVK